MRCKLALSHPSRSSAFPREICGLARAIAAHLSLTNLVSPEDRILLTRFKGPVADLPWPALPREGAATNDRLGYAPSGASVALIAVTGDVDASTLAQPPLIRGEGSSISTRQRTTQLGV